MTDRTDTFRAEIESLEAKTAPGSRDRVFLLVGEVLMAVGILIVFGAFLTAGSQNSGDLAIDNLEHNELLLLAIAGLTTSVVGAALYLRYGLSKFLRLWLLRQLYESKLTLGALRDAQQSDD